MLDTAFIFEPAPEIHTWYGWGTLLTGGSQMPESLNKKHVLFGFIFFPMNAGYLFFFELAPKIRTF
jgi:hypothetical protein